MTGDAKSKGKIINPAALQHIHNSKTYVIYLINVNNPQRMVFLTVLGIYRHIGVA